MSCTSRTDCVAVGDYAHRRAGGTLPLAEQWNGVSWAIQQTPTPAGEKDSELDGISCTTATACTAVGSFTNRARTRATLAERWNAVTWAIQHTPTLARGDDSWLNRVSCTTPTACTAVGSATTHAGITRPLAERYR